MKDEEKQRYNDNLCQQAEGPILAEHFSSKLYTGSLNIVSDLVCNQSLKRSLSGLWLEG
jgi:hypothetical protein